MTTETTTPTVCRYCGTSPGPDESDCADPISALKCSWMGADEIKRLTAALAAAPAPADAEVEGVCERLENIADASTRNDGSDIPLGEQCRDAARLLRTLSARLAEVERERDTARQYAHNLATWLYDKRYAATAPDWKPLPDLMGLLTQIDSMLASLPDDMAARDAAFARAERAEAMLRECSETLQTIVKVGTREEFERFVGGYEKIVTVSEEAEIAAALVSRLAGETATPAAPTEGGAND